MTDNQQPQQVQFAEQLVPEGYRLVSRSRQKRSFPVFGRKYVETVQTVEKERSSFEEFANSDNAVNRVSGAIERVIDRALQTRKGKIALGLAVGIVGGSLLASVADSDRSPAARTEPIVQTASAPNYSGTFYAGDGSQGSADVTVYNISGEGVDSAIVINGGAVMFFVIGEHSRCYVAVGVEEGAGETPATCIKTTNGVIARDLGNEPIFKLEMDWRTDDVESDRYAEAMDKALGLSKPEASPAAIAPSPEPDKPATYSVLLPGNTLPALPPSFAKVEPVDVVRYIADPPSNCRSVPDGEIKAQYTVPAEAVHFTAQSGDWLWQGSCWVRWDQTADSEAQAKEIRDAAIASRNAAAAKAESDRQAREAASMASARSDVAAEYDYHQAMVQQLDGYGNCEAANAAGVKNVLVPTGHWSDRNHNSVGCEQ
jgi:hypothetical protein